MDIKYSSNFSWTKLLRYLKDGKDFGRTVDKFITEPLIEDSKKNIKENKVTPKTLPVTLRKRKSRKTPKSIGGDTTLYDTGKLHDSIRLSDKRGTQTSILLKGAKRIEMAEYGKYHQLGTSRNKYVPHPKREFLSLSVNNADKASAEMVRRMVRAFKSKIRK